MPGLKQKGTKDYGRNECFCKVQDLMIDNLFIFGGALWHKAAHHENPMSQHECCGGLHPTIATTLRKCIYGHLAEARQCEAQGEKLGGPSGYALVCLCNTH